MDHFIYNRDDDTPIWRVFQHTHALSLFAGGGLYLPRPQKWDDPFENILLKQKYHIAGTNTPFDASSFFDLFFGQCWTHEEEETDATWRIYAPNKEGVRIRTTVRKLYAILDAAFSGTPTSFFYICRVDYFTAEEILKHARLDMEMLKSLNDYTGETALMHLTVKRPEFAHEKEVRVIYRDILNKVPETEDHIIIPAVATDFVEDVVVDPRMDQMEFERFKATALKDFPTASIRQSELYRLPEITVPVYNL